jgi:hypothetical protein
MSSRPVWATVFETLTQKKEKYYMHCPQTNILCQSVFGYYDKIPETKTYKEDLFCLMVSEGSVLDT